ncbi:MAG: hypothetical protein AAGA30_04940, partial [Planctomycetota bacterium]
MLIRTALFSLAFMICTTPCCRLASQVNGDDPVNLTARFHIESGTNQGYVIVKFEIPDGSYLY